MTTQTIHGYEVTVTTPDATKTYSGRTLYSWSKLATVEHSLGHGLTRGVHIEICDFQNGKGYVVDAYSEDIQLHGKQVNHSKLYLTLEEAQAAVDWFLSISLPRVFGN